MAGSGETSNLLVLVTNRGWGHDAARPTVTDPCITNWRCNEVPSNFTAPSSFDTEIKTTIVSAEEGGCKGGGLFEDRLDSETCATR